MAHRIPTGRKTRKDARYSRDEVKVMEKYKVEYKDQTTKALRAEVLRTKILVDIFNYWDKVGNLPADDNACVDRVKVSYIGRSGILPLSTKLIVQELAAWIRNNWRPVANITQSNPHLRVRAIDLVWEIRTDEVEEELKILLDVEELDNKDPRCFQQRNAAAKVVLEKMSVEDRAELDQLVETRRAQGNPEHIQRLYASCADWWNLSHFIFCAAERENIEPRPCKRFQKNAG